MATLSRGGTLPSPAPGGAAPAAGQQQQQQQPAGVLDDATKWAERAMYLTETLHGLLAGLAAVKARFDDPKKPRIYLDPTVAPVLKAIAKKFPDADPSNQLPNYGMFVAYKEEVLQTFDEAYKVFARVAEAQAIAFGLLEFGARMRLLQEDNSFTELAEVFLRLLVAYIKINLLVVKIDDRKLAAAAYHRAAGLSRMVTEMQMYRPMAEYLSSMDTPIETMQTRFQPLIAHRLSELLTHLKPLLDASMMGMMQLRQEGLLNIIHIPMDMRKPSTEGRRMRAVGHSAELVEWVYYGYLVCPLEMNKPVAVDALRPVLNFEFIHSLNAGDVHYFHAEMEGAAAKAKGVRSLAQEAAITSIQQSGVTHAERRDFARMNLWTIYHLLKDKPGLCAPKLSLILAALSFARDEITWYFRHFEQTPSNAKKAKMNPNDYNDPNIAELIYLVQQVKQHVLEHKPVIKAYYAEYLSSYYLARLKKELNLVDSFIDNYSRKQLGAVVETMNNLDKARTRITQGFRLNWRRTMSHLATMASELRLKFGPLQALMEEISLRSRYIDILEQVLNNNAGLSSLYHYRSSVLKALEACTKHPYQSRFAAAFLGVIQEMPGAVLPTYPRELAVVGPEAVRVMEVAINEISRRIGDNVQEWTQAYVAASERGAVDRVATYVRQDRDNKDGRSDKKKQVNASEPRPGAESSMRLDQALYRLQVVKMTMVNLCAAMPDRQLAVHDVVYAPSQYLWEQLVNNARAWLATVLRPTDDQAGLVRRPSSIAVAVEAFLYSLQALEGRSGADIQLLLRDILLDNVDLGKARKLQQNAETDPLAGMGGMGGMGGSGTFGTIRRQSTISKKDKQVLLPAVATGDTPTMLYLYGSWYAELACQRFINGSTLFQEAPTNRLPPTMVLHSEARKQFLSIRQPYLKIDRYADLHEMMQLADLIGSNVLVFIEERLTKHMGRLTEDLKFLLLFLRPALDIVVNMHNAPDLKSMFDALKPFQSQIEAVLDRVLAIGLLLNFVELVAEGVSRHGSCYSVQSTSRRIPHIYTCIDTAHSVLPPNLQNKNPDTVSRRAQALDMLANQVGIYKNVEKLLQRLMQSVVSGTQDQERKSWEYMPVLFAVFVPLIASTDASAYNLSLEVYDNNAGLIFRTMTRLLNATIPFSTPSSKAGDTAAIAEANRKFVRIASMLVLRMLKDQSRPPQLDSVIILLDKLVAQSKFVTYDLFNKYLPYPLVRLAYMDLYRKYSRKKGLRTSAQEESAFA